MAQPQISNYKYDRGSAEAVFTDAKLGLTGLSLHITKDETMAVTKGTSTRTASVKTTQSAKNKGSKSYTGNAKPKKPAKKRNALNKTTAKTTKAPKTEDRAKRKLSAINQRYNKSEIINELAVNTGLNRKQVDSVLSELSILISRHIKKRAAGEFVLAGLIKITTSKRPAKKAHRAVNPFTGEMITFAAKPARTAVKVHPLKGLVDMAQ